MMPLLAVKLVVAVLAASPLSPQAPANPEDAARARVIVSTDAPDVDLDALRDLRLARAADHELRALVERFQAQSQVRQAATAAAIEKLGGRVLHHLWIVQALVVELPEDQLGSLASLPGVTRVEPDRLLPATLDVATNSSHHNADGCYNQTDALGNPVDGRGTTVAIIDSGADGNMGGSGRPHELYWVDGDTGNSSGGGISGSRLLSKADYSSNGSAEDQIGHGTNTASCAAGEDYLAGNSTDERGMAPMAGIRSLNIDEGSGGAYVSSMNRAFQALAAHGDVVVANMSYGGESNLNATLNKTIDRVVRNDDIVVTLSAGNEASDLSWAHASLNALTVGSVSKQKYLSSFSTYGPLNGRLYPLLVATGEAVKVGRMDNENSSSSVSGTSFSAPITAGAVALVRQAAPEATALEAQALVLGGLDDVANGNSRGLGLGYLRARKSVLMALDGDYRTIRLDAVGGVESYLIDYNAGDEVRIACRWNRQNMANTGFSDPTVTIYNPDGTLLASTGNGVDLHAHFLMTAAQSGTHRVVFALNSKESGVGDAEVAVAGLQTAAPGNDLRLVAPDSANVGDLVSLTVSGGQAGAQFGLFAGFTPSPVTMYGQAMDVGPATMVASGLLDAAGEAAIAASVPPSVAGQTVFLEVLSGGPSGVNDSNLEVLVVN